MKTKRLLVQVVKELEQAVTLLSDAGDDAFIEALAGARRIFVAGAGRSGLMMKAFAMRLMHLGYAVHVVGETVTPGIAAGDLLVVGSGSGETRSLIGMLDKARSLHASVASLTTQPPSSVGSRSDIVVTLPGAAKDRSADSMLTVQPMGTLFEQSLLLYLDAVILRVMEEQRQSSGQMYGNHANLE